MSVLWPRVTSLQNLNFVWYPILVLHFVVIWYDMVMSYYGLDFGPVLSFSAFHRSVMMVLECLCPITHHFSHQLRLSYFRNLVFPLARGRPNRDMIATWTQLVPMIAPPWSSSSRTKPKETKTGTSTSLTFMKPEVRGRAYDLEIDGCSVTKDAVNA